jgi:hypothetical protein
MMWWRLTGTKLPKNVASGSVRVTDDSLVDYENAFSGPSVIRM